MNPQNIYKTAVITQIGLFEYVFMTFGLRNAAQTMQRYMNSIIRDIPSCYAYVDDLLIASVDQESHKSDIDLVFSKLSEHGIVFLGVEQTRITAYHPQNNGAVVRFHRHLKSALIAHFPENWLDTLPLVLLSIRSSFKQDLAISSAELVYGTTLKLPGEFFSNAPVTTSTTSVLQMLRQHVRSFRPVSTTHHGSSAAFISDDLIKAITCIFEN
ncbi:hypothetical protein AVEN_168913-1 [Araneus ventricosus]|uniref:Reverse transcriptase domain-containing protein n=1 Tax=Araneus ventricosus TaxID=182803 RepID=A0A4Y2WVC8_ARAVE|nr:hypothetical protein AVEN_168913-1 [Araneus ventricosus]